MAYGSLGAQALVFPRVRISFCSSFHVTVSSGYSRILAVLYGAGWRQSRLALAAAGASHPIRTAGRHLPSHTEQPLKNHREGRAGLRWAMTAPQKPPPLRAAPTSHQKLLLFNSNLLKTFITKATGPSKSTRRPSVHATEFLSQGLATSSPRARGAAACMPVSPGTDGSSDWPDFQKGDSDFHTDVFLDKDLFG